MYSIALMKPDKLVILTSLEGAPRRRDAGEQRMIEHHPESVTPTRELMGRFPPPVEPKALDMILKVRQLHRDSDGEALVFAATQFRELYGWHPRVEWFRILGLDLVNDPSLIDQQIQFLKDLETCATGDLPVGATPTSKPYTPEVLEWAIGANHANLMEWLWREGRNAEALSQFDGSLRGLGGRDDDARRIERHLYRVSICHRLGDMEEASATMAHAVSIDASKCATAVSELSPIIPELNLYRPRT